MAGAAAGVRVRVRALPGPSFSFLVLGLPHVSLIELRLALISYQDYHMLLLALTGGVRDREPRGRRGVVDGTVRPPAGCCPLPAPKTPHAQAPERG